MCDYKFSYIASIASQLTTASYEVCMYVQYTW